MSDDDLAELDSSPRPASASTGAALGFLALTPLFALYELALAHSGGASHNLGELLVSLPFAALGDHTVHARWALIALVAAGCAWSCFHVDLGLGPRLLRIVLEGLGAACLLGPALLVGLHFLGGFDALREVHLPRAGEAPGLGRVALLAGGAAYEELVFRMGVQGLAFLALRAIARTWLPHEASARIAADLGAILVGALVFSAAHLAVFTQLLGPGGEPYHSGIFPWRVLAGILLSALFRWRGPGVAAWTHALFNAALAIGAGPGVFL